MRRIILPVILTAVLIAASVLTVRADNAADPDRAGGGSAASSASTPLLSVRRTPEWLKRPIADTLLGRAVQGVLAAPQMPAARCIAVHRDGLEVAENSVRSLFKPGPLQRFITAAAAVEALPADSVFRTEAVVQSDALVSEEGVLEGNIWLIGGADPVLGTSDYMDRFGDNRPFTDLTTLADDVVERLAADGVIEISGGVQGDESKYTPAERDYVDAETPLGPVWTVEDNAANRIGPMSALMVNEGFTSWPLSVDQSENTRSVNPALDAADLFAQLLTDRGILIGSVSGNEVAPQGADRSTLGEIESPTFDEILSRALAPDGGTTAEMLLKEIGVRTGVTALRVNAILFGEVILLDRAGLPVGGTAVADGSGLSALNQTTCELLLSMIQLNSNVSPLLAALPAIADSPLAECVSLVDGEMHVLAVAEADTIGVIGRYVASNGDLLTFAMMTNDPGIGDSLGQCNSVQTSLVEAVAGHPYGPALDDLAPSPTASD